MALETDFIDRLKAMAVHPAARGLADDCAVLGDLVLTHDMLVAGVHFLPDDPPESVAWKLLAVNLSDLAAKGAMPVGVLMGAGLTGDADWALAFADGLGQACASFEVPLLGGDTVSMPQGGPITLGLTAIGRVTGDAPSRSGAQAGDGLYVAGVIGDAGLGLAMLQGNLPPDDSLIDAYRYPEPLLHLGQLLAHQVSAMMDVSDGLLIDAGRMARASGGCLNIDLDAIPRSVAARLVAGDGREALLAAATAGDDYALLFTAAKAPIGLDGQFIRIGCVKAGEGLSVADHEGPVPLPARLGWLHG